MTKNTQTTNTTEATPDFKAIAVQALADDSREGQAKGRGRVRCFAAIYLAGKAGALSNLNVTNAALMDSKTEKSMVYTAIYSTLFDGAEGAKPSNTFKNKLKLALDTLAYVDAMERKAGCDLVRVSAEGDIVRFNSVLLDADFDAPADERSWLSTDSKKVNATSMDAVNRAAHKHGADNGIEYPSTSKGATGKQTAERGLSMVEMIDLLSGMLQRDKLSAEVLDAVSTLHAVTTEIVFKGNAKQKKAA